MVTRSILALVATLTVATSAHALEPAASEIFSLVNGTLSSSCTANTVVTGGSPLACSATLPSQVAVSGSAITLSTSANTAAGGLYYNTTNKALRIGDGSSGRYVGEPLNLRSFLACDGVTDERATLAALVTGSGACAGRTCVVPAGCTILLSSPGAGSAAVVLASGTRLVAEAPASVTVKLARHYCNSGAFAGSYCDSSTACRTGSCVCDVGSGDGCEFAPTGASTYTVFDAAASADAVGLSSFRIDAGQVEPFARCSAGTDAGKACSATDGNGTTGCSGGGTCSAAPKSPTGTGTINVIDFDNSTTGATVERVVIRNLAKSTGAILTATNGIVQNNQIGAYDTNTGTGVPSWSVNPTIALGTNGLASANTISNTNLGIKATAANTKITDNDITLQAGTATAIQTHDQATVKGNRYSLANSSGNTGIIVTGTTGGAQSHSVISNNIGVGVQGGAGTHLKCGMKQTVISNNSFSYAGYGSVPYMTDSATPEINCRFVGNNYYAQQTLGAAIVTGYEFIGNYVSWGNQALSLGYDDGTYAVGVAHAQIDGNLFHTASNSVSLVKMVDTGKRCASGSDFNKTCTCTNDPTISCSGANTSCAGSATCSWTLYADISFTDNILLCAGTSINCIDLANTSDYTYVFGSQFTGNIIDGGSSSGVGFNFPSGSTDQLAITDISVRDNRFRSTATPVQNWVDTMGMMGDNSQPGVGDTQGVYAYFTNRTGSTVASGQVVEAYNGGSSYDNAVQEAAANSLKPLGISTGYNVADAGKMAVLVYGKTTCNVDTGAVARGDCLKVSGTSGKLASVGSNTENCFATAHGAKSAGSNGTVPCFVKGSGTPSNATGSNGIVQTSITDWATGTKYLKPGELTSNGAAGTTWAVGQQVYFPKGTINRMRCAVQAAPGASKTKTFALVCGGDGTTCSASGTTETATGVTCSITGTGSNTDCTYGSAFTVPAAGLIFSLKTTATASSATGHAACSIVFTPDV